MNWENKVVWFGWERDYNHLADLMSKELTRLGSEGWELVGIMQLPKAHAASPEHGFFVSLKRQSK